MTKKIVLTVTPKNNVDSNNKLKDKHKTITSIWDEKAILNVTHGGSLEDTKIKAKCLPECKYHFYFNKKGKLYYILDIQTFEEEELAKTIKEKTRQKPELVSKEIKKIINTKDISKLPKKEFDRVMKEWSKQNGNYSWGYVQNCTKCNKILFSDEERQRTSYHIPGDVLCKKCLREWRENNLKCTVYPHHWGIILPGKTGVWYEQQTCGCACNHVKIQGSFIPLSFPEKFYHTKKQFRKKDLLNSLTNANYNGKPTDKIWQEIDKEMRWQYEVIDAPEGQPDNQEGLVWIKFTKFPIPRDKNRVRHDWDGWSEMRKFIIGKPVCLIYPNCD